MFSADLGVTPSSANYIEDVFSTYLYTGNGSTQTITNGIDLSTKGGLVWIKGRADNTDHSLTDTVNGTGKFLSSNTTTAITSNSDNISAFSTTGFTASFSGFGRTNENLKTYASWTFRKQAKFFDVVTYTGDGTGSRSISHSLGSLPGCIIVKRTDAAANWQVFHRSLATNEFLSLNTTAAAVANSTVFGTNGNTTTTFSVGSFLNGSSQTFVAYLFAYDAGGFGATGSDNVISCGSFTTSSGISGLVNIGFEPQWVLIKRTDSAIIGDWQIYDNMRGVVASNSGGSQPSQKLLPNSSAAETTDSFGLGIYQQGFNFNNASGISTYIYIAIRRGPMKTPTVGTSVFDPEPYTGDGLGTGTKITTSITVDATWFSSRSTTGSYKNAYDRLRGATKAVNLNRTDAETTESFGLTNYAYQDGFQIKDSSNVNTSGTTYISWNFRRAPGFFDVVCYTGTGSATTFSHNLGVAPELMIVKDRVAATNWVVYSSATGATKYLLLNQTSAAVTATAVWNDTAPTSSVFTVGTSGSTNNAADTFVAYLFATVAGVSKVGSYTGTGTTLQIDCGFTGGARFVLIKRTDSSGDWYVWDSARGIVAGNDPYLLLNSTAAEVTSTDYVDTYSAGFEISSTAPAAINANGGSFIFLAIA